MQKELPKKSLHHNLQFMIIAADWIIKESRFFRKQTTATDWEQIMWLMCICEGRYWVL